METAKKVFCSKCKHFTPNPSRCDSPLNLKHYVYNWYDDEMIGERPSKLNQHNNCKWYEDEMDSHSRIQEERSKINVKQESLAPTWTTSKRRMGGQLLEPLVPPYEE